jgi:hypothetical protein
MPFEVILMPSEAIPFGNDVGERLWAVGRGAALVGTSASNTT